MQRAVFTSNRLMGLAKPTLLLTLIASLHAWHGGTRQKSAMNFTLTRWLRC